ncbi:MAG: T9SS type A sorting domain-containing protein [Bacteroidia bacterium]|nr:T9SS type A sorting domain-containing protein [Bacteroidia bacterium]
MKKITLLFILSLFAWMNAYSQPAASYIFINSTGAALEDMSSGTTQLIGSNAPDDSPSTLKTIGFTFVFANISYTTFSVTPDGFVKLGAVAISQYQNNFTVATNQPKIAAYWDDLHTGTTGGVKYKLLGTAPNRKLVIQWFVTVPKSSSSPANATFQVWLNETSNAIEFVYGAINTGLSYSVGISGSASDFKSITTSATPTASTTVSNNSNTLAFTAGIKYVFMPQPPSAPDAGFTASTLNPIIYQPVNFADTSESYPSSWHWTITPGTHTYVNGTSTTTQNPWVKFTTLGLYTVKLVASNMTGSDSITKTNYINVLMPTNAPVAGFTASYLTPTITDTVLFTDTSQYIATSWKWNFTPNTVTYVYGTTDSTQNPRVKFNASGLYTVRLIASNAAGADTAIKPNYINVLLSYCASNMGGSGSCPGDITLASINGTTFANSTHTNCSTANGSTYGEYPATGSNTGTLTIGANYDFKIITSNYDIISMWIDYNHNGTFDSLEWKLITLSSVANSPTLTNFTVPVTALTGATKLRIRTAYQGTVMEAINACTYLGSGITEDYIITLAAPLTPVAGFEANLTTPIVDQVVSFTDTSLNYPSTWQWQITPGTHTYVNGTTNASQNPKVAFGSAGLYTVQLIVSNMTGSDTAITVDYINVSMPTAPPDANFIAGDTLVNTMQIDTLTDLSTGTPTAWNWIITPNTFGYVNGTSAASQNPQVQFNAPGYYTVQLNASNAAGDDSLIITNYIHVLLEYCQPVYTTGTSSSDYLAGVHLDAINNVTTGAPSPYYTYYSAMTTDLMQGSTHTIILTNGSSYSGTLVAWIDFNYNGVFESSEKLGELNVPINGTASFVFTVPPAATIGTTRLRTKEVYSSTNIDPCATYTYGETEDYNVNIIPLVMPTANFMADVTNPIIDQLVTFTDTSANYPTSWYWTIAPGTHTYVNGTADTTQNPQVKFTAAGLYTAKLVAANLAGADSITKTDYINVTMPANAPVAGFYANNLMPTTTDTVTFTDTSQYVATSWQWNFTPNTVTFVNGTNATTQHPKVKFNAAGYYTAELIASNAAGSDTANKINYIHVIISFCTSGATSTVDDDIGNVTFASINNGVATPSLNNTTSTHTYTDFTSLPPAQVMIGATYPISVSQINSGSYYTCYVKAWIDFNQDGVFNDTTERILGAGTTSTSMTVTGNVTIPSNALTGITRMRVVLQEGGSVSGTLPCGTFTWGETEDYKVQINPPLPPLAAFTVNIPDPIINQVVTFTDTSANYPSSWLWYITPGSYTYFNGTTATTQNPQVKFTATGLYTVKLAAANIAGADSITKIDYINVTMPANAPIAGFYANNLTPTTADTVTFTDTSQYVATSWQWNFTPTTVTYVNGTNSATQNPQVKFNTAGLYTAELIATNAAGTDNEIKTNYITVLLSYCVTNLGGSGSCPGDISLVAITGTTLNNTSHTSCSTANSSTYGSYPGTGNTTAILSKGTTYQMKVTTTSADIISMWIDYNQNGTFATTEWTQVATVSTINVASVVNFTVPANALTGQTKMRIRSRLQGNINGAGDACTNFGSGITEDYIITIAPPLAPDAGFTADLLNPIINQVVAFTDTSANYPSSWHWTITPGTHTYINGTSATTQNPQVKFTATGLYTVKLVAANTSGSDSVTKTNYINVIMPANPPVAGFYASNITPTTLDTVIFTDTSQNIATSWQWSFTPNTVSYVNGTNATTQNPKVKFNAAGLYTVELIATNAAGSDNEIKTDYIHVVPQYCIPAYTGGTTGGDYLSGVQIGTINNITTGAPSPFYTFYSSQSTTLIIGSTNNTISLTNGGFAGTLAAWIDFNGSGVFDTGEKLGETANVPTNGTTNIVFTVPSSAVPGTTRLRVREVFATTNIDPCSTYGYGEAEDYVVNLQYSVNIVEITKNTSLSVYPNPSNELFNLIIKTNEYNNVSIELFSVDGRQVYKNEIENINEFNGKINVSKYSPGIYILIVNTGKDRITKRLIIE